MKAKNITITVARPKVSTAPTVSMLAEREQVARGD